MDRFSQTLGVMFFFGGGKKRFWKDDGYERGALPLRSVVRYAHHCVEPNGNASNSSNKQIKMAVMGNALTTTKKRFTKELQLKFETVRPPKDCNIRCQMHEDKSYRRKVRKTVETIGDILYIQQSAMKSSVCRVWAWSPFNITNPALDIS